MEKDKFVFALIATYVNAALVLLWFVVHVIWEVEISILAIANAILMLIIIPYLYERSR